MHVGSNSLYQELKVENTGSDAFDFTAALHTYFSVSSIQQVSLRASSMALLFLHLHEVIRFTSSCYHETFFVKLSAGLSGHQRLAMQIAVGGLQGLQYYDNTTKTDDRQEREDVVRISGETDRIYKQTPNTINVSSFHVAGLLPVKRLC